MTNEGYIVEKSYWTERDFNDLGWHDSKIHGISFDSNNECFRSDLLFDIDYIFNWVNPQEGEKNFTFWISPCTLVFHDVLRLKMDLDSEDYLSTELEISEIKMVQKKNDLKQKLFNTEIETNFGNISFETSGFEQFVRVSPKHSRGQWLDLEERDGVSFDKIKC